MYNATKLFYRPNGLPCLRTELVLTDAQTTKLKACQTKIRAALKEGLKQAATFVSPEEYYNEGYLSTARSQALVDQELRPRFRTQGSWVYDTLNRPAQTGQQIDLDDGMYVPMSIVEGHPTVASAGLYRVVELILEKLCEVEGWSLDTSKNICVRVIIDREAHVDINIYAVPDDQLGRIEKRAMAKALTEDAAFSEETLQELRLESDQIYVAHRRKGWEQSDPLELEDWFKDAVARHSKWTDVTRIVRYVKAWRDQKWVSSSLSSLSLMVCVVEALDEANSPPTPNRDDDGLLVVARALPSKLASTIFNPVLDDKVLNGDWSLTDHNAYELAARGLRDEMAAALEAETTAGGVVARIRKLFGPRVPDDPALVSAAPLLSQIRSTQPRETPSPKVGSHTSG